MKSWEPIKAVPCLHRFLTSAAATKRRVSTAPALDCKVMNDEQLLVWRLQILAGAIGPLAATSGTDLKAAVEVKERQGLMNELLTLLPEYRPEVQALIAQNLVTPSLFGHAICTSTDASVLLFCCVVCAVFP